MKKTYVSALFSVLIWATGATLLKSMFAEIPNLEALSVSSIFSFAFLLVQNLCTGKLGLLKSYTKKELAVLFALGFVGLFLYNAFYYKGISILTAQEACILNYLWPVLIVVFSAVILKERVTCVKVLAILCSFAGVVVLSMDGIAGGTDNRLGGAVCCMAAAACYALFCVCNKKADLDQNITMMIGWGTVAVCAGILGIFTENWVPVRGTGWLGLLWMGIIVNAIAYLTWALALNNSEDSSRIANLAYLTPFFSIIFSAVFLHEKITVNSAAALLLIIGGVLISQIKMSQREPSP